MHAARTLAAGIEALPDTRTSAAYTQAAWRFLNNPRVGLQPLAQPLLTAGLTLSATHCERYALVMHDWSRLNYGQHTRKRDRRQMTHHTDVGYELQSAVLVSDVTGKPLAPLVHNLVNDQQVYTTRQTEPVAWQRHLDELSGRMHWLDQLDWSRPLIHLVDREADSAGHWRTWDAQGSLFLIRAKDNPRVCWEGSAMKPTAVADRLAFSEVGEVRYHGRPARQCVAQTEVRITRRAKPAQKSGGKRVKPVAGKALPLRLVISRIHDGKGRLLAQWLLLTNVPDGVDAATLARWYYYRWQIESMFKLLKSEGHHVEQWMQDDALALAKRLVVASCACILVWQLAAATCPQALEIQHFLVRLSGRQTKRRRPVTIPALFEGIHRLFSTLHLLEHYDVQELKNIANFILPHRIHTARDV